MIKSLDVAVELELNPQDRMYGFLNELMVDAGNELGKERFGGEQWHGMQFPSEEKLRIWQPTQVEQGILSIPVTPYQWSDLQAYKQLQPNGKTQNSSDPLTYVTHAIALTANGVIETADDQLVFHYKKGGTSQGSIHAFGGYVSRDDLAQEGIATAITRELGEKDEIGLQQEEMEVQRLFGTPEGMSSTLWGFGTSAVYGIAKTELTSRELQARIADLPAGESLTKKLCTVPSCDLDQLASGGVNVHPQTAQVLPTLQAIYGE